jgi:hypothetical protein
MKVIIAIILFGMFDILYDIEQDLKAQDKALWDIASTLDREQR